MLDLTMSARFLDIHTFILHDPLVRAFVEGDNCAKAELQLFTIPSLIRDHLVGFVSNVSATLCHIHHISVYVSVQH